MQVQLGFSEIIVYWRSHAILEILGTFMEQYFCENLEKLSLSNALIYRLLFQRAAHFEVVERFRKQVERRNNDLARRGCLFFYRSLSKL